MSKSQGENKKSASAKASADIVEKIRHSLAHIMATAVQELFPGAKFGIGPAIENGFYYDFDLPSALSPQDLPKIEAKMRELIKKDLKFERKMISYKEAEKIFKNQPYKLDLINSKLKTQNAKPQLKTKNLSIYIVSNFTDLCAGPHVRSTKEINPKAFKLTKIAGAYWLARPSFALQNLGGRGDEKNPMLTRIYGLAFETEKELKDHLQQQEEAEKRDHRALGQKLGIYSIDDEVGPGLILWHPKGALLIEIIRQHWIKEHLKNGYQLVETPHIGRLKLWQTSGHTDFYKENMYSPMEVEGDLYQLKPMNCPFHVKIYKSQIHSYRDLPLRWAEWAQVYRYEKSGVLHGLTRVRGFTQDDAHIICTTEQFEAELQRVVKFTKKMLKDFGFKDYGLYLSVRDLKDKKKFVGDDKAWDFAEKTLENVLKKSKLQYVRDVGEAKFYGPAIDIKIKDAIGREWQCSTLQLDMNLPQRFEMFYINKKGKKQTPIMLHRTLLGGICRFVAVLLEHYAGTLPFWLSPEQIWIIPVGTAHKKYSRELAQQLQSPTYFHTPEYESKLRVKAKDENETVSKKIREGELQKIPYLLVVGDKEVRAKSVRVRQRGKGDRGEMKIEKFIKKLQLQMKLKR